jgi:hypothetical protein
MQHSTSHLIPTFWTILISTTKLYINFSIPTFVLFTFIAPFIAVNEPIQLKFFLK